MDLLKSALRQPKLPILLLTLVALALRVWRLERVPPGWRDDELIETLVISQKVLDGEWAVYYPDASGHEALYHVLNAAMLAMFGPTVPGIRWLSAILGTVAVPLTYVLGRRLFGRRVGLVAAAALAVSFWSLMYSRFGIRHVALPPFALASFIFFWRGLEERERPRARQGAFVVSGLFLGVGFYTYFASRGAPLILAAFGVYLLLVARPWWRQSWRGLALLFAVISLLTMPLALTLRQQPEAEARVAEVARPLLEAQQGNLRPALQNTVRTLNMFHSDGDDEWLYNIPYRPLFGPVGALFFWAGLLLALWQSARPVWRSLLARRRPSLAGTPLRQSLAAAFLSIWWLAGISPGFLSVPAGSLSHTILAQPAVYLLAALPLRSPGGPGARRRLPLLGTLLLLGSIAARDLPDYYRRWPERGMVRFLYRADIGDVARYLAGHGAPADFGVTGLLAGPWDRLALELELEAAGVDPATMRPRWYHPERALFLATAGQPATSFVGYPVTTAIHPEALRPIAGATAGGYRLIQVDPAFEPAGRMDEAVCFTNGLCLEAASYHDEVVELSWRIDRPLALPPIPLVSNPPPPGVYAGPRLYVFAQLLDGDGRFLAGDDGLWVDPLTLHPGDGFLQQHRPSGTDGSQAAVMAVGLYDPMTGRRILTDAGRDHVALTISR